MKTYSVTVTRVINARPEQVYHLVSDMNEHRKFLPKEFERCEILEGGVGEGTVVLVQMNVMGTRATSTLTMSEPEPGRVIREANQDVVTSWTFLPADGGTRCQLTLHSDFRAKPGLAGFIERLLNPGIIRGIYNRELDLLDAYARKNLIAS